MPSDTPSASEQVLSPTKRALRALQTTRARLETLERAHKEPIAIVGMGCRLPNDIETPQALWRLLQEGGEAVSEVPASRWPIDHYYHPDGDVPGKMVTRHGAFLDQ